MMKERAIFCINRKYTWLREALLRRLPDGSLCCVFFTGGSGDGDIQNVVAALRSDDDGDTWTEVEILVSLPEQSAWAPSMITHNNRTHIFWCSSSDHYRYFKKNHILSTGDDGRNFTNDRLLEEDWITERGIDIRHGTLLRDGRILLPFSWHEPVRDFNINDSVCAEDEKRFGNFQGITAMNNIYCVGVLETDDSFSSFAPYGKIYNTIERPFSQIKSVPLFEPAVAELSNGDLALLIRGDGTNRLWRADSSDGGRTWSEAYKTDIPNPGSKPRIINLSDGRIILFSNPSEKDYSDIKAHGHKYRTPLEMWVSDDDMNSWYIKETLVPAPKLAQYPDGFYDEGNGMIYLVWEDDKTIYFTRIQV